MTNNTIITTVQSADSAEYYESAQTMQTSAVSLPINIGDVDAPIYVNAGIMTQCNGTLPIKTFSTYTVSLNGRLESFDIGDTIGDGLTNLFEFFASTTPFSDGEGEIITASSVIKTSAYDGVSSIPNVDSCWIDRLTVSVASGQLRIDVYDGQTKVFSDVSTLYFSTCGDSNAPAIGYVYCGAYEDQISHRIKISDLRFNLHSDQTQAGESVVTVLFEGQPLVK